MRLRTVKGTGAEARRVSVSFLLLESACFRRVDSCRTVICEEGEKMGYWECSDGIICNIIFTGFSLLVCEAYLSLFMADCEVLAAAVG